MQCLVWSTKRCGTQFAVQILQPSLNVLFFRIYLGMKRLKCYSSSQAPILLIERTGICSHEDLIIMTFYD